ncbi:MAG: Protein FecR [Pseudomonas citronellolis]|nr:MAG: Protein FecR [Pseudomonas citronellolis]
MPAPNAPITPEVARQAARWLMLLHEGRLDEAQRQACAHWRAAAPEHERAWQRVEQVQARLGVLPPALAMATLNRERRQALKKLLVLAALLPAGYLGYRQAPWPVWTADYRTAIGERRTLTLADGSRVELNTDSAIDVQFSAGQRLIRLLRGEILVDSGADSASPVHRPLRVASAQGLMQALGTRFDVRQFDGTTLLGVVEGTVRVTPRQGPEQLVEAGQTLRFGAGELGPLQALRADSLQWTQGQLVADDLPLGDFLRELGRYRAGWLRCDDNAARLRISGGFQLDNTDAILAALPATLPVQVVYRSRYWVSIRQRE